MRNFQLLWTRTFKNTLKCLLIFPFRNECPLLWLTIQTFPFDFLFLRRWLSKIPLYWRTCVPLPFPHSEALCPPLQSLLPSSDRCVCSPQPTTTLPDCWQPSFHNLVSPDPTSQELSIWSHYSTIGLKFQSSPSSILAALGVCSSGTWAQIHLVDCTLPASTADPSRLSLLTALGWHNVRVTWESEALGQEWGWGEEGGFPLVLSC